MKRSFVLAFASVVFAAVAACSSSSSGNSNNGNGNGSCAGSPGASSSASCTSCLQSKCSSQVSGVQSACATFESCYCACAPNDANCKSGCEAKIDASCQSAASAATSCQQQSCAAECSSTPADAGSGGDSSSLSASCAKLSTCCTTLPSTSQTGCQSVAQSNYDQACSQYLAAMQDAGTCQ